MATQHNTPRLKKRILAVALVLLAAIGGAIWYLHTASIPVLQPKGEIASKERQLIYFALGLSLVVVIPVFAMLFTFAWKYRAGNTKAKYQPDWGTSKTYETLWWAIPSILILVLSVVTWRSSHALDPFKPISASVQPVNVQVVALQWKWLFIYPDQGVATVNYMPVPVGAPINLTITSDAPMNAFWVPRLGGQVYAMSGMSMKLHLKADQVGVYNGRSANISGSGFSDMTFTVNAMKNADFHSWAAYSKNRGMALSQSAYDTLAKPGTSKTQTYGIVQSNLYDKIIEKYMGSMDSMGMTQNLDGTTEMSQDEMGTH